MIGEYGVLITGRTKVSKVRY